MLRLALLAVVALSSLLGATLAALPALAVGLLTLFDTSFGSTLAVLRALVEPFLWPGAGASGLMHVRDLMTHPAVAAAWSVAASALAACGLALSADRRAAWWWALAAWGACAAIGGEAVGVVLVPAGVARGMIAIVWPRGGQWCQRRLASTCEEARPGSPSACHSNGPSGPSEPSAGYAQTRKGPSAL